MSTRVIFVVTLRMECNCQKNPFLPTKITLSKALGR